LTDRIAKQSDRTTDSVRVAKAVATKTADLLANGLARQAKESAAATAQSLSDLGQHVKDNGCVMTIQELAARQLSLGREITELFDRPSWSAAQQKTRIGELAHKANELARLLRQSAIERGSDDPASPILEEAGKRILTSSKLLTAAKEKTLIDQRADAEKDRLKARSEMQEQTERIAKAAPSSSSQSDLATIASVESLQLAESAMKKANRLLGNSADVATAEKGMRSALEALRESLASRMHSVKR
jgi:hypothetical protein